jgi:predicted transglutaminase-like cysteine proteinase
MRLCSAISLKPSFATCLTWAANLLLCAFSLLASTGSAASTQAANPGSLFGFHEQQREGLDIFPQWTSVLKRHAKDNLSDGDCNKPRLRCHLAEWQQFLGTIKGQPARQQLTAVNTFANEKKYVLDIDIYGAPDYWAIPREFLYNDGDCEDFAILKYMSLRQLGFSADMMRVVVLQDTNLRTAHAVLALYTDNDILILDNQAQQIVSHRNIVHYVPIFSVNEKHWWMHTP